MTDTSEPIIPRSDQQLFVQIIEAEAHPSWDMDGYTMLAQTVINQLETGKYGDTVKKVLTHGNNYSVYTNGRYLRVGVSDNAKVAVNLALRTDYMNHGQLYFCTDDHLRNNPDGLHGRSERVARYDNVIFFR